MEKRILRNLVSIGVISLFLITFAGVAVSGEKAAESMTIKGEITSINADTGQVVVKDELGKMMDLQLGPEQLKDLKEGDKVSIEALGGKLKSITKQ